MENRAFSQIYANVCTPGVRIIVYKNKVECFWRFRDAGVSCIFPEVARSEVRYQIAKFTQKFVCVLLTIRSTGKTLYPGSSGIAVVMIEDSVKAPRDSDWGSRKV